MTSRRRRKNKTKEVGKSLPASVLPQTPPDMVLRGPIRLCIQELVKLLSTLERKENFYRRLRLKAQGWLSGLVAREL